MLHNTIQALIDELRATITEDIKNGTIIPGWYNEIKTLLNRAESELNDGSIEESIELLGAINIDAFDQIDIFDSDIGELILQLKHLEKKYVAEGIRLPQIIVKELQALKVLLQEYLLH